MPRKQYVPYPETVFDKNIDFPLENFPFPSCFDICSLTDIEIISFYQKHNLVHTFCPNKICQRFDNRLVFDKRKSTKGQLLCRICSENYPSKPKALKHLHGNHQFLLFHLYSFCLGHDQRQGMDFLGTEKKKGDKIRHFRKRMQSVIIRGLETEDKKLGGGVENPVMTDEMQKGRRRKGNGAQRGHPSICHGDVVGACDNQRYRFTMTSKKHPGPPRIEQVEETLKNWLVQDSTLVTDGAKCYITFQEKYPELVTYLIQLNHSVGEWTRQVSVEGGKMVATTNKIDGAWSHLRNFFRKHMVSQKDAFRYLKEFEFRFGAWAKSQNSLERLLNFMHLDFDLNNLDGPELSAPWTDLSNSNTSTKNFMISKLVFVSYKK